MAAELSHLGCPTPRKGAIVGRIPNAIIVRQPACKRWICPTCGPSKAYLLSLRVQQTPANIFLTLTHKPRPAESQEEALRAIKHSWTILRKRIARHNEQSTAHYVLVVEWTKRGAPHLHVLIQSRYIAQATLSSWWASIHGAPIVDIRRVRSQHELTRYLSKYLTKDTHMPKRSRKWSASRGFLPPAPENPNPPFPPETEWTYYPNLAHLLANALRTDGDTVIEGPRGSVIIIGTIDPHSE